jgi:hypothetical protein
MEIGIKVVAEDIRTQAARHVNSCFFTMVAVDDDRKPVPVPPSSPASPDEKRRWEAALVRKQLRPSPLAASPTTSPAPPTSPTTSCAAACAWCRPSACPTARWTKRPTPSSSRSRAARFPRPKRCAKPAGAAMAARAGRRPDLLQVLLHLRLDAGRQHRPGDRSLDGRAGHRLHHRLSRVPRQRPHGVQGLPVRRRRAAARIGHAQPPADADDGFQPGARAAGADAAQGGPDRLPQRGARRGRHRRAHRAAARRACRWRSSTPPAMPNCWLPARPGPAAAGDRGLRHRDRPAAELRAARGRRRCGRALPPHAACARSFPAAARWPPTGRCAISSMRWQGFAIDPLQLAQGADVVGRRWPGPIRVSPRKGPVLVYATAEPEAVRAAQAKLGVEARRRAGGSGAGRHRARLVQRGVGQLVVAGGETSGSCRAGAGCFAPAHRAADRARRAVVPCPSVAGARGPAPCAEVRQLRRPDFFREAFAQLA